MAPTPATKADFNEAKNDIFVNSIARSLGRLDLVDHSISPRMTIGGLLIVRAERRALRAGWAKIPQEIKDQIIEFAMIADGGEIRLHCLTLRESQPNVALSLLRVNRKTYDLALNTLYAENSVVFTGYGSDLKLFYQAIRFNIRLDIGIMNTGGPFFGHVTFDLGDKNFPQLAWPKITAFGAALLSLPYGFLTVKNLTINLLNFSFKDDDEIYPFAEALSHIEVTNSFTLKGSDYHLKHSVREFAAELQINEHLKTSLFVPQDGTTSPGYFEEVYEFASSGEPENEDGEVVKDATSLYKDWKTSVPVGNSFVLESVQTSYLYTTV